MLFYIPRISFLIDLLQDILKYTRLKYSDEDFKRTDLNTLAKQVANQLTEGNTSTKIKVGDLPEVMGVPFFLQQLFSNLISNSIKYAKAHENPIIEISAQKHPVSYPTELDELYYVVSVKDNGIGFDQKYSESIFNVFTRLHLSTEYSGSGIGLALCKKIMVNHKGYITAKSSVGKGTEISLYFPVRQ